ncbi:MAG: STAS domain-containing protein [Bacteroidales bacterium]|nr:STAS domain-containing protein [Bacteroidales bacterium]
MIRKDFIRENHLVFTFPEEKRFSFLVAREMRKEMSMVPEKEGLQITIDLEKIHFVDSAGFDFLVDMVREAEKCRFDFELVHVLPEVTELVRLLHLENILGTGETTFKSCL